ncbi:MAG: GHKL domain-containing protein [Psychrilyobacter sp.]|nr:GHKL domain-containing protein [Psychrilyobacter sp.]
MKLEKKLYIYILIFVVVSILAVQFVFFKNASKILEQNRRHSLNGYVYVMSKDSNLIKFLEKNEKKEEEKFFNLEWVKLIRLNYFLIVDREGKIVAYKTKEKSSEIKPYRKEVVSKMFKEIELNYKEGITSATPSEALKENKIYNIDVENGFYEEFVPIIENGVFLGMLVVQEYYTKHSDLKKSLFIDILIGVSVIFVLALILSVFLAKNIKKGTLGIDPIDVGRMYAERQQIFDTISDEIITIDSKGKVIKRNKAAEERLQPKDEMILIKLYKEAIAIGEEFYDKKYTLTSGKVFISGLLIQKKTGLEVLFIIKQEAGVKKLAKEITGVTQIIDSMRANVHEFKNKIHVISGLLRLEEYEEVKKYVSNIEVEVKSEVKEVENINDPIIKAILLTKMNLAKEREITLNIEEESNLMKTHGRIDSDDLIIIIGNLIENAMESFVYTERIQREIHIFLLEDTNKVFIQVSDNGSQIEDKENIFKMGYSSKGEGRGSGLALIKNVVEVYDGTINLHADEKFKMFSIEISKGGEE